MSMNENNWNESLLKGWAEAQQKYWDTWSEFAKQAGAGSAPGNGQASVNPFEAFNPLKANPFVKATFAQNPFAHSPFGHNPFAQNAFSANPFAAAWGGDNPFAGMLEQWWSTLKPDATGDLNTVAERFFDMGKGFMSMAEGMFGAAGQDHPDAAMDFWMSSMQAALQQWIGQIQNNIDFASPDLPGVSGATLNSWAQFADSVAPWLNMSQHLLKEIAEGHLPGGIEMPGVGAAQEQFLRALSMPGLGYTREQQERMQELARHLLTYHDAFRAYKLAFAKTALASLRSVQKRLQSMHEEGNKIESLRAMYDMWIDGSEEAYAEFAMSDEYQVVYGDLVNALMQVRQDMNHLVEQQYQLMNIPTRSEIDTMQHRQQENRRENRMLRHEIAQLRADLEKLARGTSGARPGRAAGRKTAKQETLPIDQPQDDLTAIKGIGPKMAEKLYQQGIDNYAKLAKMNQKFAEQLDEMLNTQGRILRDDWIGQAKKLLG